MQILVIENKREAATRLKNGLTENGFTVDVVGDGEQGSASALRGDYSLILLSVALPRRDGWSVISEVRRAGKRALFLVFMEKDSVVDRIKGFYLGADAYLVKPYLFLELLAQIRSLLRRNPTRTPEVLRISDLELDFIHRRASRAGKKLDLSPKEFNLLALLVRHAGEVLSRNLIAEQVWDMNFEGDTSVVDIQISRLRAKVDDPFDKKLIHTVRGRGYVFT